MKSLLRFSGYLVLGWLLAPVAIGWMSWAAISRRWEEKHWMMLAGVLSGLLMARQNPFYLLIAVVGLVAVNVAAFALKFFYAPTLRVFKRELAEQYHVEKAKWDSRLQPAVKPPVSPPPVVMQEPETPMSDKQKDALIELAFRELELLPEKLLPTFPEPDVLSGLVLPAIEKLSEEVQGPLAAWFAATVSELEKLPAWLHEIAWRREVVLRRLEAGRIDRSTAEIDLVALTGADPFHRIWYTNLEREWFVIDGSGAAVQAKPEAL